MIMNIAVVVLVLLIGYWWANQGLFSAIIHLLCVIVAGAVALAFWEMLAFGLLMRGGRFDHYAPGVSLLITLALVLFILVMPAKTDRFSVDGLLARRAKTRDRVT